MISESDDPLPSSETPDQERDNAVEELITGDSDGPPLCEEAVEKMIAK